MRAKRVYVKALRSWRQREPFELWLSFYLPLGLICSHALHAHTYSGRGGAELQTWLHLIAIEATIPIWFALVGGFIVAGVSAIAIWKGLLFARTLSRETILRRGLQWSTVILIASQLPSSSAMRVPYEALFCAVSIGGVLVRRESRGGMVSESEFNEARSLIKFFLPLTIGLPILASGISFIAQFYAGELDVIRRQIYRHFFLSGYFLVGAVWFLLYPLVRQILIYKDANRT